MKLLAFLTGSNGGGTEITVVDNYTALLALPPTANTFYWCQNSQGTAWLPGSLGGAYYPKGIYYCFTTSPLVIEYIETPYQATQTEVNTGTNDDKFVTPKTLLERVAKYLQFNTTDAQTRAVGKVIWNDTDGTLEFGLKGGNVNLQIGQEQVVRVVNKTGTLISNGKVVRVVAVTGGVTGIALAQADSDANSATVLGITTEDIENNEQGFITIQGLVHGVNTNSFNEGDVLYLSPTTAGELTNIKPVAPQHMVIIGYVAKKNASDGHILLHVQNGYELEELHNVKTTSLANNEALVYNSATSLWENKTIIGALGYTPQAQFLSKLVFKEVYGGTTSSTSETILATFAFAANELPTQTTLYFETLAYKTAATVNGSFRIRVNTSNTLVGATQLATWGMGGNTNLHSQARRRFGLTGGNVYAYPASVTQNTDIITSTSAETVVAADVTNALYFFVTFTANSSADTLNHIYSMMKNF